MCSIITGHWVSQAPQVTQSQIVLKLTTSPAIDALVRRRLEVALAPRLDDRRPVVVQVELDVLEEAHRRQLFAGEVGRAVGLAAAAADADVDVHELLPGEVLRGGRRRTISAVSKFVIGARVEPAITPFGDDRLRMKMLAEPLMMWPILP